MNNNHKIIKYEYKSSLAIIIDGFINEKRACGFIYNTEAKMLYRFDKYILSQKHTVQSLPRNIFEDYTSKTESERERNHRARLFILTQFSKYMSKLGYTSYIPTYQIKYQQNKDFIPYIFTEKELALLFAQASLYRLPIHCRKDTKIHYIIPVIFHLLYGCGLRLSEALNLRVCDVDIEKKLIRICDSKMNSNRIVPFCNSLKNRLENYIIEVHSKSSNNSVFFPNPSGNTYSNKTIYSHYRMLLWKAGISHGGKGNGPRLHDLRHTFAVHCLKKWVQCGDNVLALLPLLSAYLGHKGIESTQYYLRLTYDMYPSIISTLEKTYGNIIPSIGGAKNEVN